MKITARQTQCHEKYALTTEIVVEHNEKSLAAYVSNAADFTELAAVLEALAGKCRELGRTQRQESLRALTNMP